MGVKRWIVPFLMIILIGIWGCSKAPSKSQIRELVRNKMQVDVPPQLAHTLLPASKAEISVIEVRKVGEVQTINSKEYYPAIVYSKGTCVAILGNRVPFEGEQEYYFWKTAYGDWTVTHLKENIGK